MADKLVLKNVSIELPTNFKGNPNNSEIVEWLEYRLGARCDIKVSNPLCELDLCDCNISASEATLNGKQFTF